MPEYQSLRAERFLQHVESNVETETFKSISADVLQLKNSAAKNCYRTFNSLSLRNRKEVLNVGICSTFTIENIKDWLKCTLSIAAKEVNLNFSNVGFIENNLFSENSGLNIPLLDAVFVFWRLEDLIELHQFRQNISGLKAVTTRVEKIIQMASEKLGIPIFFSTFVQPCENVKTLADGSNNGTLSIFIDELNLLIKRSVSKQKGTYLLDLKSIAGDRYSGMWNEKFEHFAMQPFSQGCVREIAFELAFCLEPLFKAPKKVLAVDLDNTIWGGVLGEDGIENLQFSGGYPGKVFQKIQYELLTLKDAGVLLCLITKNNEEDVIEAFQKLPGLTIGIDDFSYISANWLPKSQNLIKCAIELNLGLDSLVFLDDSAFEQSEVYLNAPSVCVIKNNGTPESLLKALTQTNLFAKSEIQKEDLDRNKDYLAQKLRKKAEDDYSSPDDFLHSLELKCKFSPIDKYSIGRAHQMIHRTNQFNISTRRHTEADLNEMVYDQKNICVTFQLSDKFGDQGIVGLLLTKKLDSSTLFVDTFLLSCRAIGRSLEKVMWSTLIYRAKKSGYKKIKASFIPSAKNQQVSELLDKLGMTLSEKNEENIKLYDYTITDIPTAPTWFKVNEITK